MTNSYAIGKKVTLTFTFKDQNGAAVDPASVTVKLRKPDGTLQTWIKTDLTNPTVGTYTITYTVAASGWHEYEAEAVDPGFEAFTDVKKFYGRISN